MMWLEDIAEIDAPTADKFSFIFTVKDIDEGK
jgi:hypothetical protein